MIAPFPKNQEVLLNQIIVKAEAKTLKKR